MLDIMRKHASSWGIKAILAMIILSFVLFFGYSKISRINRPSVRGGANQAAVAVVNKVAIPESDYRFYYDNTIDRMRQEFKGKPIPDSFKKMIEQSTLSQLIRRELLLQIADKLGLGIANSQLAQAIRLTQKSLRGEFDPVFYTHQYLPYFENRFGINFEDMLRNDLRAEEVQILFKPISTAAWTKETEKPAAQANTKFTEWSFEVATLDVDKMIEKKTIPSSEKAHQVARELADNPTAGLWKRLSKQYKFDLESINGVTLKNRRTKLKGYSFDEYSSIFSLNEDTPVVDNPLTRKDNKIVVVRMLEKQVKEGEASMPERDTFFHHWMNKMAADSKIRTFLNDQK